MVFIFYAFGILIMLLLRPLIARKFLPKQGKFSIYAALYFFPIFALFHAIGGGLICKFIVILKLINIFFPIFLKKYLIFLYLLI